MRVRALVRRQVQSLPLLAILTCAWAHPQVAAAADVPSVRSAVFSSTASGFEFELVADAAVTPQRVRVRLAEGGRLLLVRIVGLDAHKEWLTTPDPAIHRTLLHRSLGRKPVTNLRVRLTSRAPPGLAERVRIDHLGDRFRILVPIREDREPRDLSVTARQELGSKARSDGVLLVVDISRHQQQSWSSFKDVVVATAKMLEPHRRIGLWAFPLGNVNPVAEPRCEPGIMVAAPGALRPDEIPDYLEVLRPHGRAAPLAATLDAINALPSVDRPGLVIVFSSGSDSCGGRPLASLSALSAGTPVLLADLPGRADDTWLTNAERLPNVTRATGAAQLVAALDPEPQPKPQTRLRSPTEPANQALVDHHVEAADEAEPRSPPLVFDTVPEEPIRVGSADDTPVLSWAAAGASVVLAGAGAWMGLEARAGYNDLRDDPGPASTFEARRDDVAAKALAADVLVGAAVVSASVAFWLFLTEE